MKVIKVSGDSMQEMLQDILSHFGELNDLEDSGKSINEETSQKRSRPPQTEHKCHCERSTTPDISKVFWIDKKVCDDNVLTVFNVIAPFAIKNSIKATITKIENEQWLILRYENDETKFSDCTTCNFKINKQVEYKYNFRDYKVDKKKLKLNYENGILSLVTVSSKISPKNDDYVIGL